MKYAKSGAIWLFLILLCTIACGPAAPVGQGLPTPTLGPTPIDVASLFTDSATPSPPTGAVSLGVTASPPMASTPSATLNPTPTASVTPTPTQPLEPTPTELPSSAHAEMYDAINTVRAAVSEFPLEVDMGLEMAAQIHAERGAWNSGLSVEPLLFDQGVQCRETTALTTGYPDPNPRKTRDETLAMASALYLPDAAAWAAANEDYATHLFWWMEWPDWDVLFLGNYTHMGYGAVANPKMSHPARGNHPGVIILCRK